MLISDAPFSDSPSEPETRMLTSCEFATSAVYPPVCPTIGVDPPWLTTTPSTSTRPCAMLLWSTAVPRSPMLNPATPGLQNTPMPPTHTPGAPKGLCDVDVVYWLEMPGVSARRLLTFRLVGISLIRSPSKVITSREFCTSTLGVTPDTTMVSTTWPTVIVALTDAVNPLVNTM